MNERKTQKKTAAKPRFKLDFTEQICTPKKLIPVVIYRLYPELKTSLNRKAELAKRYIKHLLCRECKIKYVSHWTNDFHALDGILCKSCNCSIKTAIASASKHQNSDWFKKLTQQLRFKRKAIQYELELRFNKPFSEIAKEWHIKERLSAIAMQERLLDEFRMSISPRDLQRWLGEIGIIRSHRKALRNRVVTGRMNYSKRIIDYSKRIIDYDKIKITKQGNPSPTQKHQCIRLPVDLKDKIAALAKQSGRTQSEVVRDALSIAENINIDHSITWHRIDYVLTNCLDDLKRKRTSNRPGHPIILIPTGK